MLSSSRLDRPTSLKESSEFSEDPGSRCLREAAAKSLATLEGRGPVGFRATLLPVATQGKSTMSGYSSTELGDRPSGPGEQFRGLFIRDAMMGAEGSDHGSSTRMGDDLRESR